MKVKKPKWKYISHCPECDSDEVAERILMNPNDGSYEPDGNAPIEGWCHECQADVEHFVIKKYRKE
tara:strand:+ start:39 stop:236 length:198 start_codon:yes stop_codon:yes gene_type:complete